MLLQHTFVSDGPAETAALVGDLSKFYGLFGAWFTNKRPVTQAIMAPLTPEERAAKPQFAPDKIAQGFDQFSIWIDSGIAHARKKKSLDLFIRHVLPAFA